MENKFKIGDYVLCTQNKESTLKLNKIYRVIRTSKYNDCINVDNTSGEWYYKRFINISYSRLSKLLYE